MQITAHLKITNGLKTLLGMDRNPVSRFNTRVSPQELLIAANIFPVPANAGHEYTHAIPMRPDPWTRFGAAMTTLLTGASILVVTVSTWSGGFY